VVEFEEITTHGLERVKADVGLGGVTINVERELILDFSHSTFRSSLGIAVPANYKKPNVLWLIALNLWTWEIPFMIAMLESIVIVLGFILWYIERGNDIIPQKIVAADVGDSGWEVGIIIIQEYMTTIGSGRFYPGTRKGYLLAFSSHLLGYALLAIVSAPIISAFTVRAEAILESAIYSTSDLRGKMVATVTEGTTSEDILDKLGAIIVPSDEEHLCDKLLSGEAEAVVYDTPYILYYINSNGTDKITMTGPRFDPQDYGIALRQGSELQEDINRALLEVRGDERKYKRFYEYYFGELL